MAENTKSLKKLYAAFATGDMETVLSGMTSDMNWTEAEGFPYPGTFVGPQAILDGVFMRLATEWEGFAAVPEIYVEEGDRVVVLGKYSGKYLATGKSMVSPFAHSYTFRDGKAATFVQYTDTVLVQKALA